MTERLIFTYQTRLDVTPEQEATLQAYAALYGHAERSLFAALDERDEAAAEKAE